MSIFLVFFKWRPQQIILLSNVTESKAAQSSTTWDELALNILVQTASSGSEDLRLGTATSIRERKNSKIDIS